MTVVPVPANACQCAQKPMRLFLNRPLGPSISCRATYVQRRKNNHTTPAKPAHTAAPNTTVNTRPRAGSKSSWPRGRSWGKSPAGRSAEIRPRKASTCRGEPSSQCEGGSCSAACRGRHRAMALAACCPRPQCGELAIRDFPAAIRRDMCLPPIMPQLTNGQPVGKNK